MDDIEVQTNFYDTYDIDTRLGNYYEIFKFYNELL